MQKTKFFFPLTKVDAEQRLVYGRITSETVDKANEIFDYDSSKPFFEKWSQGIAKAAAAIGAVSLGNVRAMHGSTAAGKLVDLNFDDVAKTIDCCAKIIDDAEWSKVLAGVYTGFSMGGAYVKRWADPADPTKKRFTANPAEVSIVDNPCVTDAHFSMIKADGIVEEVDFKIWVPDNAAVANKAVALATEAGKTAEDFEAFIEPAREALVAEKSAEALGDDEEEVLAEGEAAAKSTPAEGETPTEPVETPDGDAEPVDKAAAVTITDDEVNADLKQVQRWAAPDGTEKATKAEARDYWRSVRTLELSGSPLAAAIAAAKKAAQPVTTASTGAEETFSPSALADEAEALGKALAQIEELRKGDKLEKGFWMVSEFAEALARLVSTCRSAAWEAESEKDGSTVPSAIAQGIATLGAALVAMAKEEVAEALVELQEMAGGGVVVIEPIYVELAAAAEMVKADSALMEKVGARNSKKDAAKIQATHDHMAELGAKCAGADKAAGDDELAKVARERDDLAKQVEEAIPEIQKFGTLLGEVNKKLADAQAEIDLLKAAPAPMPQLAPGTKTVEKGADGVALAAPGQVDRDQAIAFMKGLGAKGLQDLMLDASFANPISV